MVIPDFHLDAPCLRVPKSVPQCFGRYLVDFVAQDGMQISWLALNRYPGG